jgi:hypothetical protein
VAFESGNIPKETLDYLASKKVVKSGNSHIARNCIIGFCAFLACALIAASVFGGGTSEDTNAKQGSSAVQDHAKVAVPYQPDELISEAKGHMVTREYQAALDEIGRLNAVDSKRPGVQSMFNRATHDVQLAALKEARSARVAYAQEYERALLEAGGDYTVRAQGPNADILSVTFVLINRPFVYKMENDDGLNATWISLGFKSVRLGDGFDSSWSYKLKGE